MGKNIIDLSGGQINDPSSGKDFSLPFLPATSSSPSQTLAPHALLLLELRRYKDIVTCGAIGAPQVLWHCKEQQTQTLIAHLLQTNLLLLFQKLGPGPPLFAFLVLPFVKNVTSKAAWPRIGLWGCRPWERLFLSALGVPGRQHSATPEAQIRSHSQKSHAKLQVWRASAKRNKEVAHVNEYVHPASILTFTENMLN